MRRKIGYARDFGQDISVKTQKQRLIQQAHCLHCFEDENTRADQPKDGLQRALATLQNGDELIVCNMSRLTHNLKGLLSLLEAMTRKGVALTSLDEAFLSIDCTPQGQLMHNVIAAVAAFEAQLQRTRTRESQRLAKENGTVFGRPAKLTTKEQKEIYNRVASKMITRDEAAKKYGISRSTISRLMHKYGKQAPPRKEDMFLII